MFLVFYKYNGSNWNHIKLVTVLAIILHLETKIKLILITDIWKKANHIQDFFASDSSDQVSQQNT